MPAEGRRTPADIDGNVEDRAGRYPQQLGLSKRRNLEVKPANRAPPRRQGMVLLHERNVYPV